MAKNNYQELLNKMQAHVGCSPCTEEEYENCKFKINDCVKIVNYGSLMWVSNDYKSKISNKYPIVEEKSNITIIDRNPELINKTGTIDFISFSEGKYSFILKGPNKVAWYNEKQLEKI
jgi:hypothetical protein